MRDLGRRFGTLAVHSGLDPKASFGAVSPPIYQSATFTSANSEELEAVNSGASRGFVYSRVRNPTVLAAEQRVAALEGAESAVIFGSGMAAIAGSLAPFIDAGDEIVVQPDLYGGTFRYFREILPRQGVVVRWAAASTAEAIAAQVNERTRVVYAETPTNPLVRVVDIAAIAAVIKGRNARLIVDGTLAGPFNQHLLTLGADLVVYSASKYLNGHSDLIAGCVTGDRELTRKVRSLQQASGAILDPHAAWLLLRGMSTLHLRMAQHNASGLAIAKFLLGCPEVAKVHYPGLPAHPDFDLARRQMTGFGGLLSFELTSASKARQIVDKTRLFGIGPSIGGVESLISQPSNTSHHALSDEDRRSMGIADELVRIAIGVEDVRDLIADLQEAMEQK